MSTERMLVEVSPKSLFSSHCCYAAAILFLLHLSFKPLYIVKDEDTILSENNKVIINSKIKENKVAPLRFFKHVLNDKFFCNNHRRTEYALLLNTQLA